MIVLSPVVRHDLRSRDYDNPTDDVRHGQVSRHAEQREGVYEAARGAEGAQRTRDGLRGEHLGDDQGPRHRQGTQLLPQGYEGGYLRSSQ